MTSDETTTNQPIIESIEDISLLTSDQVLQILIAENIDTEGSESELRDRLKSLVKNRRLTMFNTENSNHNKASPPENTTSVTTPTSNTINSSQIQFLTIIKILSRRLRLRL